MTRRQREREGWKKKWDQKMIVDEWGGEERNRREKGSGRQKVTDQGLCVFRWTTAWDSGISISNNELKHDRNKRVQILYQWGRCCLFRYRTLIASVGHEQLCHSYVALPNIQMSNQMKDRLNFVIDLIQQLKSKLHNSTLTSSIKWGYTPHQTWNPLSPNSKRFKK